MTGPESHFIYDIGSKFLALDSSDVAWIARPAKRVLPSVDKV